MTPATMIATTHHQNSARLARPEKVAYFERTARTASIMTVSSPYGATVTPQGKNASG